MGKLIIQAEGIVFRVSVGISKPPFFSCPKIRKLFILKKLVRETFSSYEFEYNDKIAHNGQGFLLCWYSVIRQPKPKLTKVNAVDVIFFSQYSRKPHVSGSGFSARFLFRIVN